MKPSGAVGGAGVAAAILGAACQVTYGAGALGSTPRTKPNVRVGVVVLDDDAVAPVLAGLRRDPHVESVVAYEGVASLPPEERSICASSACGPGHRTVCRWAHDTGLDYFVVANLVSKEWTRTAPGSSGSGSGSGLGSLLDIHGSSNQPGPVTAYEATARLLLEVSETETCSKDIHLSRQIDRSTNRGAAQGGGPERVRRELLAGLPALLADTFPAEIVIGESGRARAAAPEGPKPDGYYGVYRNGRFAGVTRVQGAGTPAQRTTRLTCCFQLGAGDVLVQGRRPIQLELAPSFSLARLSWNGAAHAAPGFGFRARLGPLATGWQAGLAFDLLYAPGATVGLGTIEAGYHWRPSPAWTLAVVGGAGAGSAATTAGEAADQPDARGVHATAAVVTMWQPGRDFYLALDLGYVHSARYHVPAGADLQAAFELRGPMLRFAAGLR